MQKSSLQCHPCSHHLKDKCLLIETFPRSTDAHLIPIVSSSFSRLAVNNSKTKLRKFRVLVAGINKALSQKNNGHHTKFEDPVHKFFLPSIPAWRDALITIDRSCNVHIFEMCASILCLSPPPPF